MNFILFRRQLILPSLISLAVLIVVFALIAPADKVLGDRVRLVYVHAGIIRVVLATFMLAALLSLAYLIFNRSALLDWARALAQASLILWAVYVVISFVTTIQTWGGIAWFEPRWIFTLQISALAPIAYLIGVVMKNTRVSAVLNIALAGLILWLEGQAQLVLHPLDPIGLSGDTAIQFAYFVMLILWALIGLQLVRGLRALATERAARSSS